MPETRPVAHDLLLDLTRRYCEPHRRYHSIRHIADMLWMGRELALDDVQVAAVWFHDAVYDIPGPDNEERSAVLAEQLLARAGWAAEDVAEVARIVRDTRTHVPSTERGAAVLDLDLASLAAEPAVFEHNTLAIREEYASVPDPQFWAGHRRVLESFLAKDRIYHTAWGARREERARANLEAALVRLDAAGR